MMTVADVIRNMNDADLAMFFYTLIDEQNKVISESLEEQGISNSIVSIPALSYLHHLNFLKQPAENVFHFEEGDNERPSQLPKGDE